MDTDEPMDKEQIKKWLTSTGHDREWLAGQIGCTVGTLNQWFSKLGFPDWAAKSITRLANPVVDPTAGLEVEFSASEFELIEKARALSGHLTRSAFYEDAISEYAKQIIAQESAATETGQSVPLPKQSAPSVNTGQTAKPAIFSGNITPMQPQHFDRAAEEEQQGEPDQTTPVKLTYPSGAHKKRKNK